MDRRLSRESSLQKKLAQAQRPITKNNNSVHDLMADVFYGNEKKAYNNDEEEEEGFDDRTRSNSSRTTQEWLDEARRMVASSSPSRCDSPMIGSPRFAAQGRFSASSLDRRDPLSRSARRHRAVESFSGEILTKSAKHSRNNSDIPDIETDSPTSSPADSVHKWFSNFMKTPPSDFITPPSSEPSSPRTNADQTAALPPRQSSNRKSRFQTVTPALLQQGMPGVPSCRTFKTSTENTLLSSPKNPIEPNHRRTLSSDSNNSFPEIKPLSPPRNLVESAHRRSISKSTCFIEKIPPNTFMKAEEAVEVVEAEKISINEFLREQRIKVEMILNGELNSKAKIVLPGHSNSTSSMVAAICYAWLLENRERKSSNANSYVVVPVMNMRRQKMWRQLQAAWLFHHVGLDATSLFFADEVDLESLMMAGQLNMVEIGKDVLKINAETGSRCTILADNYCEDAYDLLQTPILKKLLLASILLETQNLSVSAKLSTARDAEAVQLLLAGSAPNYRNTLFDQLMEDQRESLFLEALQRTYGKPPIENGRGNGRAVEKASERKPTSVPHREAITSNSNDPRSVKNNKVSPKPAKPNTQSTQEPTSSNRGKNTFFLAKWFGFGK